MAHGMAQGQNLLEIITVCPTKDKMGKPNTDKNKYNVLQSFLNKFT